MKKDLTTRGVKRKLVYVHWTQKRGAKAKLAAAANKRANMRAATMRMRRAGR